MFIHSLLNIAPFCVGVARRRHRAQMMGKGDRKTYRSVLVLAIAYPKLRLGFKTVALDNYYKISS
jgi:hypothetical protein